MRFEDDSDYKKGTKFQKYSYYIEYYAIRGAITVCLLGLLVIYWDGWVKGSAQYHQAKKTVDICFRSKDVLMDSDHLRNTCSSAEILITTYPTLYALKYTMVTILDWFVYTLCQIGASWVTSSIMGVIFAMIAAYTYRRVTGPENPFAMSSMMAAHQQANFANAMALANSICAQRRTNNSSESKIMAIEDVSEYTDPIDYGALTGSTRRRSRVI